MNLYLDTSAIAKLFIKEPGTEQVQRALEAANVVACCGLGLVEAHAALERAKRSGRLSASAAARSEKKLDRFWANLLVVDISEELFAAAISACHKYGLRAYDAVHFAAALQVKRSAVGPVYVVCFDAELAAAWDIEELPSFQP